MSQHDRTLLKEGPVANHPTPAYAGPIPYLVPMVIPRLRQHSANTSGRDFVVGDVHGCMSALQAGLDHVGFHPSRDRLFLVGDLVDRGPLSEEALGLLKKPWAFSCRGNHEQMLIDHWRGPAPRAPYEASWLQRAYRTHTDRQRFAGQWLPLLDKLPLVMAVDHPVTPFFVVHAELLDSGASVTRTTIMEWTFADPDKAAKRALWGRSLLRAFEDNRPVRRAHDPTLPLIYCGHSITPAPIQLARQVYLDGGACLALDTDRGLELPASALPWSTSPWHPCLRLVEPATGQCWEVDARNGQVREATIVRPPSK